INSTRRPTSGFGDRIIEIAIQRTSCLISFHPRLQLSVSPCCYTVESASNAEDRCTDLSSSVAQESWSVLARHYQCQSALPSTSDPDDPAKSCPSASYSSRAILCTSKSAITGK